MDAEALSVLVVDDDRNIRNTLIVSLQGQGCRTQAATSVPEAESILKKQSFDLVLTDFRMEGKTGLDLTKWVRDEAPDTLTIVMTAYASFDNAVSVVKEGAFDYLPKPFTNAQLTHILGRVKKFLALRKENETLKKRLVRRDYFAGFSSPAMARLEEFAKKIAPTEASVLLTGESGTGKSELARLMHELSSRRGKPFVTVDCTTLVETLIESELFGHTAGAFTGATKEKVGKMEVAEGGTLFLDEIAELTLPAQAKLLRFLQERVIERVGGNTEIRVDARVIAATNKNLSERVREGKFREDLFFRLNTFEATLVALRHRREDVPILIHRFLSEAVANGKWKSKPELPAPIVEKLLRYSWPGNVRELRNVIERLMILAEGREPRLDDLPDSVREANGPLGSIKPLEQRSLSELERAHIKLVLEAEKNQERAAEILGITTVTLWRKRKEYGLP